MLEALRKILGLRRQAAEVAPVIQPPRPAADLQAANTQAANQQAADVLRREGNAHLSEGRLSQAENCYARAVVLSPQDAALHLNLGYALLAQRRYDEALASLGRSSALDAQSADAAYLTGRAFLEQGHFSQALPPLEHAAMLAPDLLAAKVDLAHACAELGRLGDAMKWAQSAATHAPHDADAQAVLARALRELGHHADALTACDAALRGDPSHADALAGRATVLVDLRRFDEAIDAADAADSALRTAPAPHRAAMQRTRSIALGGLHRHEEGLVAAQEALALDPANPDNWCAVAGTLQDLGRFDEALAVYAEAIEKNPANAQVRWDEALCRLLLGDFEAGWRGHEARLASPMYREVDALVKSAAPRWDGSPLAGRRLLLHAEQGLGDAIQFARYAPELARSAHVILQVQPALAALMGNLVDKARQGGSLAFASMGEAPPPHDLRCSLLSVPAVLAEGSNFPRGAAYIGCKDDRLEAARAMLGALGVNERQPLVGIVWSGNPRHHNDHNRSLPLARFLRAVPGQVQAIALQPEMSAADRATLERSGIAWAGQQLHDFVDTAALVQSLDLVVTVDTSVAHLAGAMGRPVWLLLPHRPDWRWLLGRDDTPWYPSMRLFRQPRAGDWDAVIEGVKLQLESWAQARMAA